MSSFFSLVDTSNIYTKVKSKIMQDNNNETKFKTEVETHFIHQHWSKKGNLGTI
jgi:hypothetical protein